MKDEIKEILRNCEKEINEASGYNDTADKILDYITNLQEENERLQQSYTDEYNLRHKLSLELSVEKDKVLELSNHLTLYSCEETMLKQIEDYKSRNEKATEKLESIRTFGLRSGKTLFSKLIYETIDILQGEGKDE